MPARPQVQIDADRSARSAVNEKLSAIRDRAVASAKKVNKSDVEAIPEGEATHVNHGNRVGRINGLQAILEWLPQFTEQVKTELLAIDSGEQA